MILCIKEADAVTFIPSEIQDALDFDEVDDASALAKVQGKTRSTEEAREATVDLLRPRIRLMARSHVV